MKFMKPSKKKAKAHLIEAVLKDIAELERKLVLKQLFLIRIDSNQIPIKIEGYKDEKWYLTASDKELNEWAYTFVKK